MTTPLERRSAADSGSQRVSRLELVIEQQARVLVSREVEPGDRYVVGRAPECDLCVDDPALSRRHATLDIGAGHLDVLDTSSNGTLADGTVLRNQSARVELDRPVALGSSVLYVRRVTEPPPLRVLRDPEGARVSRPPPPPSNTPLELRREVHRMLLEHLDMNAIDPTRSDDPALRPRVLAALRRIARLIEARLPAGLSAETLIGEVADEALGLGPLERLLADPTISEIMVIDAHHIFVEREGRLTESSARFTDEERVRAAIERIVTPLGRRIDESSPLVDARLADGSRVNVVIRPLALRGSCITIRKFSRTPITLDKLLAFDALSSAMARFLQRAVRAKKNIVISGGTGSGKTTLLNVLSASIPDDERIVTIEDAAELQLTQPHVVSLESRPANMEGKGAIAIRELVKNALRMRPDRIVVGECRGGETLDMLQAMNTGHDGSLTTTHANSPMEALIRLETLSLMAGLALPARAIREQIEKSVHLVVQQARLSDGSRKLTAISELAGLDPDGSFRLRPLFEFVRTGTGPGGKVEGDFEATGYLPSFLPELLVLGLIKEGEPFL
ncbi:MAG: ATPase, T2SS/T4P/T4SS family [Polyangiales bacterium]